MNRHIEQSGKNLGSFSKIHTVPTSPRKAKTFLEDEYLKEIQLQAMTITSTSKACAITVLRKVSLHMSSAQLCP